MKSPVKDLRSRHISNAYLREIFPPGSIVESFLFYSGQIEFSLCQHKRFVYAHTTNYPVYEFWSFLEKDATRIYGTLTAEAFKFDNENMYDILQERWPMYDNPYFRSALFFLLNRCSSTGLPSKGTLDTEKYTPAALNLLKNFKMPDNFYLELNKKQPIEETIVDTNQSDFLFLPIQNFDYNLFDEGYTLGHEETYIHHRRIKQKLDHIDKNWVVLYNYHRDVMPLYKDYNHTLINKYGRPTDNESAAEEIIIANF